jgi:hypothetical protein
MEILALGAPTHYSKLNPQPIEAIERWGLGFHLGNVVKYVARAPSKGDELKDLKKAKWYLDRWIVVREAQLKSVQPPAPEQQV